MGISALTSFENGRESQEPESRIFARMELMRKLSLDILGFEFGIFQWYGELNLGGKLGTIVPRIAR